MQIGTLREIMRDFATDPCKSWGPLPDDEQFLDGKPASVTPDQSDRNTARILSGTYTPGQLKAFDAQCDRSNGCFTEVWQ